MLSDLKSWLTPPTWVGATLWVSKGEKIPMVVVVVVVVGWGVGGGKSLTLANQAWVQIRTLSPPLCVPQFPLGK